jgi:branched-chain amino acid transport system permease protein
MFLQLLGNGIIMGSVFALVALGFALIYNATRVFHIAYAVLYMFAPYMVFLFSKTLGFPLWMGISIAIILTMLLSVLIEGLVYQPLLTKGASLNTVLISSIGIMIVVINVIAMSFGNEPQVLRQGISSSVKFSGLLFTYNQLLQISVSVLLMTGFILILKHTKLGLIARALRDDEDLITVLGVNIRRLRLLLFALSAVFAAVGGILISYDVGMDPYVGMTMLLNGVVALIIGGMGRFGAPILGGFVIGIMQALTVWAFSARWQDAVTFTLLILFLLFRPQGLLGEQERTV